MKLKTQIAVLLFLIACAPLALAQEKTIAITNAKIYPITGPIIEKGTVLIRDGKIIDVGANVSVPADASVIDAGGKRLLPGFIDSNCHAGLEEVDQVQSTVDSREGSSNLTPQVRVTDAFFPDSKTIGVARANGITSCIVSPADGNIIGGSSALIEFSEKQVNQIVIVPRAGMNATLGESPKNNFGSKEKMPETRMGSAAVLRETLQKAKEYGEKWKRFQEKKPAAKGKENSDSGSWERDLGMEALQDVMSGKIPLVVAAHRVDDIMTAVRVADEFGLKQNLVISHGTDAYKVADILAKEKIAVLVGPVTTQPDSMETLGAIYENAARLQKAGVLIGLQSNDSHSVRNLPYDAGLAVANGLPYDEALKAITINPARIFHADQELGSIEKGKRADLILADGDPLEPRTVITKVFIGGVEIPDSSYQRQMWEQFQKQAQ